MRIKQVMIAKEVKIKISRKHGIKFKEIKEVLLNNPLVRRTRDGKYIALNVVERYLTVVFAYSNYAADIVTAYPSSDWQIKLFKKRRK